MGETMDAQALHNNLEIIYDLRMLTPPGVRSMP